MKMHGEELDEAALAIPLPTKKKISPEIKKTQNILQ